MKTYQDIYTTEEWIEYFQDAGRRELNAVKKSLGNNHLTGASKNKRDAINALLA